MLEKTKIKNFLIYYISQRIIIFPIYEYLPILANTIIRDFQEWDLLEGKKITQKEKYFKYFLEKELDKILETFIILFKDLNIKIITVYKETLLNSEYSEYFLNYENFSNIVKYKIKKKTKYFKEIKNDSLFLNTEGYYKNIRVGVPSGEDIEFFYKLNKLK
jgi:hypothetical protein